jgi:multidrug efflux pump
LSVSILISLVISLTTTPMMCSRLLRGSRAKAHTLRRAFERGFERHAPGYERSLGWALHHRRHHGADCCS